jgi:hypothetical protein
MKKAKKVTRIAYSDDLNPAKFEALFEALNEIAKRCGSIRTEIWRNYGSVSELDAKFRPVRDFWIASGHIKNLPQRIWRSTLSDTLDNIKARRLSENSFFCKTHFFNSLIYNKLIFQKTLILLFSDSLLVEKPPR